MAFESKFGDLLLARCQKAFVKHLERLVRIQHPTPATRGCRFLSLMTVEAAIAQALGLAATVAEVEAVPLDDTIGRARLGASPRLGCRRLRCAAGST